MCVYTKYLHYMINLVMRILENKNSQNISKYDI